MSPANKRISIKGIIYEENKLEDEFKDCEKTIDKFFIKNHNNSPYYKLFVEIEETIKNSSPDISDKFIDSSGNVDWDNLIKIKSTNELNEVFIDSISINLNIDDVDNYQKILKEELKEVKENIGLYKSSWGYMASLEGKLKSLDSNIDLLKRNRVYKESKALRIHFTIKFNLSNTDTIDVEKQYFKIEVLNDNELLNLELNSIDCLNLIQLRNWGVYVKNEIYSFIEMREIGIDPGKQNHILKFNTEDELDIGISNLDIN